MRFLLILFFILSPAFLFSQSVEISGNAPEIKAEELAVCESPMSNFDGAVLGLVEGLTEFLPVSSTGHLILANNLLGLNSDEPAVDGSGKFIKSENGGGYYTVKDAVDAYCIVIQIAAIAAVLFVYWKDVSSMLLGLVGKSVVGFKLLRNLIIAFIPALFAGLLLHRAIENYLFSVWTVIYALIMGALAMFFVQDKYGKSFNTAIRAVELHELSVKKSFIVGLFQCIALWPGTSRSMVTIIGAYAVGLRPVEAAKFSFLLGFITLSAASVFKIYSDGVNMFAALPVMPLAIGFAVAFASSVVAAKWLVGFLNRRGLAPFAWYRILLAALLVAHFYFNAF